MSARAGANGKSLEAGLGGTDDSGVMVSGLPGDGALTANAGAGGEAGAGSGGGPVTQSECDLDGGCSAVCHGQTATCGVVHSGFACELDLFADMAVSVSCGQAATVGTAQCGGCGSVTVQVYFDGTRCWEGMPDCTQPGYAGKFLLPHSPK